MELSVRDSDELVSLVDALPSGAAPAALARSLTESRSRGAGTTTSPSPSSISSVIGGEHEHFTAEVYQNEYLPDDGTEVNAIVTVSSADRPEAGEAAGGQPDAAEIVIVDTSGLDGRPADEDHRRPRRHAGAIDCIRTASRSRVIAGTQSAQLIYPPTGQLVPARTRPATEAKRAAARLRASGGTAIGSWLRHGPGAVPGAPGRVCHAILLTDGENQHETPEELDAVLAAVTASSNVTAAESELIGWSASCGASPRSCSARSTSSPTPPIWPPTSAR